MYGDLVAFACGDPLSHALRKKGKDLKERHALRGLSAQGDGENRMSYPPVLTMDPAVMSA